MRNLSIKSVVAVAVFVSSLGCSLAQTYRTEANVTVKLTGAYTKDNPTVTKGTRTTYSSKLQTYRLATREIIDAYRSAGFIPEIDGWKIIAVTRQAATSYVLRKSGRTDVPVNFLILNDTSDRAETRHQVEDSNTGTVSSTVKYQNLVSGDLRAGQFAINFVGKATGSQTWRIFPTDAFYVSGSETFSIFGSSGGSTTTGTGTIEGSISRGSEKVIKEN
jgi:hypothetical protein